MAAACSGCWGVVVWCGGLDVCTFDQPKSHLSTPSCPSPTTPILIAWVQLNCGRGSPGDQGVSDQLDQAFSVLGCCGRMVWS